MINSVELSSVLSTLHLDLGLTDFLKKKIEKAFLDGKPIIKFVLSRTGDRNCTLKVLSAENKNHTFEDVEVFDHRLFKSGEPIDNNTKVMVYSLKYFTKPPASNCNWNPVSPDRFPEIEIEFKPSLLEFIKYENVLS